jgi:hypothetical protein
MKYFYAMTICALLLLVLGAAGCAFKMDSSPAPEPSALISGSLSPRQDNPMVQSGLIMPYDTDQLILRSDCIAQGQVVEILPSKQEAGSNGKEPDFNIFTDIIVQVEHYFWGGPGDRVVIRIQGGKVGNLVMWAEDVPLFARDEKALFFLSRPASLQSGVSSSEPDAASYYIITGAMQGKYEIQDGSFVSLSGQIISPAELERKISRLRKK